MNIEDIPNKKWTKGMVLKCLSDELASLNFNVSPHKALEHAGPVHIKLEVDVRPWYKDNTLMDTYILFLAEPRDVPIAGSRLWPPAMDICYIKEFMGGGSKRTAYPLGHDQPFSTTSLHTDIQEYVLPFMKSIQHVDGYFNFLLGTLRKNGPKDLKEIGYSDIALLVIAIITAHKMSLSEYATQAAILLQKLRSVDGTQREQLNTSTARRPEVDTLINMYSPAKT